METNEEASIRQLGICLRLWKYLDDGAQKACLAMTVDLMIAIYGD